MMPLGRESLLAQTLDPHTASISVGLRLMRISIEAVGADDQLDSVSCIELGQEAGDVCLRGPDSDVQLLGDLVVGLPGCHEGEHVTFAAW